MAIELDYYRTRGKVKRKLFLKLLTRGLICLAIIVALLVCVILINSRLTGTYSQYHQTNMDLASFVCFLKGYVKDNAGRMPKSWNELDSKGLIGHDSKAALRLLKYCENPISYPERLRWVTDGNLDDYYVMDSGVVRKSDGSSVRLVWIDGEQTATEFEKNQCRYLINSWRSEQ